MKKNIDGFSLIELLIVVVIIGIIAAIAIPNLLATRRAANEGSAVSNVRMLYSAQRVYATSNGAGEYAGAIGTGTTDALSQLGTSGLIDTVLATGVKSGYQFIGGREVSTAGTPATFFISANPTTSTGISQTGARRFGVATDGVIKADGDPTNLGTAFDATTVATASPLDY